MPHVGHKNPFEAVDMFRAAAEAGRPFNLLLLDSQMSGMDGLTLTRTIRAMTDVEQPSIVLLRSGLTTLSEAQDAGVNIVLSKPVRHDRLFDCLAGFLIKKNSEEDEKSDTFARRRKRLRAEANQYEGKFLLAEDNAINVRLATAPKHWNAGARQTGTP